MFAGRVLVVDHQGVLARRGLTSKRYGAIVQHCWAVVNPRLTTVSPERSSHCTLASNDAATPSTVNGLCTVEPSAGLVTHTCASTSSDAALATGLAVDTPSTVEAGAPSTRNVTGIRFCTTP